MNLKEKLEKLGLLSMRAGVDQVNLDHEAYQLTDDVLKVNAHRDFLRRLDDQEGRRMEIIENKTNLIVSQTAIVFSLLSLSIPFLIDKAESIPILLKLILLAAILMAFFSYMLSLRNAIRNFDITRFKYQSPGIGNVISFKDKSEVLFAAEEVRDLLSSVSVNKEINNRKGTNLLQAYNAFKLGNVFTGTSVAILVISLLFLKQEDKSISIKNELKIQGVQEINKTLKNIKLQQDTIIVKLETQPK